MKNTMNGRMADGYAPLDGYVKYETPIIPHLISWETKQEFLRSCEGCNLTETNQKLNNLTLVFINRVNALLAMVMSEQISTSAFFWACKRLASDCDDICLDATMTAIVNDQRFSKTEQRNLLELLCGNGYQRGDKIWSLRNKG